MSNNNNMNLNIRFRNEAFPLVVPSDANLDQLHTAMLAYQKQQQRNSTSSTTTTKTTTASYRFVTSSGDEIIRSSSTNLRSYGINNDSIIIAESVNNTSPVDVILTSEVPNVSHTSISTLSCAVSLRAPKQMEQESKRVPIDLVMVIDRSGSMSNIMPLVKTTLEFMVSQLMSEDRLCLITYDDRIETIFPLTKMSADAKQLAQSRIAGIEARGGTDLASGLFHGLYAVLSRALENRNQVASVLLFTDGQANQGITDQATIIDRIKDISFLVKGAFDKQGPQQVPQHRHQYHPYQRQQQVPQPPPQQYQQQQQQRLPPAYQQLPPPSYQQAIVSVDNDSKTSSSSSTSSQATPTSLGCTINTFGFGSQHNASLLKCIAECGNGLYFYMENNEQIGTSFVECIGGLLSTVVQDISITLNVQEGVQFVKVHSGAYQQTSSANGKQILVRIPDLRSEEERDILCTVQLSSQTEPVSSQPILSSHLAYYDLVSKSYTTTSSQLFVARVAPSDPVLSSQTSSVLISKQLSRIDATDALEDAKKQAANGQLASAREQLTAAIARVTKRSDGSEYYKQLLQSLQEALNGMVSQQQYQQQGQQYIEAAWSGHAQQRSNVQAPMYQNQNQARMQTAYSAYKSR